MNPISPKQLRITADERDIAIRTLYGEVRGEKREGRIAVAWVIRNRVTIDLGNDGKPDWWGEGVIGVCCKAGQFSCWNDNLSAMERVRLADHESGKAKLSAEDLAKLKSKADPNLAKLRALKPNDPAYQMLGAIVDAVFAGEIPDPTWGSTHYHTISVMPKWARGLHSVTSIGAHLFYNNVP